MGGAGVQRGWGGAGSAFHVAYLGFRDDFSKVGSVVNSKGLRTPNTRGLHYSINGIWALKDPGTQRPVFLIIIFMVFGLQNTIPRPLGGSKN